MSAQATLSGGRLDGAEASPAADVERETSHGAYYRNADGDLRFALHRCPACEAAINPHRWPAERTVPGVDEHIHRAHDSLADFGVADPLDSGGQTKLGGKCR